MGQRRRSVAALLLLFLTACSTALSQPAREPARAVGYSGMALIEPNRYLVVHDTKPGENKPRLGILSIVESGAVYTALSIADWKSPDGPSNDLESACSLSEHPGEFLVAESGYWEMKYGRVFHLRLSGETADVVRAYKLPLLADNNPRSAGDNFEGLACVKQHRRSLSSAPGRTRRLCPLSWRPSALGMVRSANGLARMGRVGKSKHRGHGPWPVADRDEEARHRGSLRRCAGHAVGRRDGRRGRQRTVPVGGVQDWERHSWTRPSRPRLTSTARRLDHRCDEGRSPRVRRPRPFQEACSPSEPMTRISGASGAHCSRHERATGPRGDRGRGALAPPRGRRAHARALRRRRHGAVHRALPQGGHGRARRGADRADPGAPRVPRPARSAPDDDPRLDRGAGEAQRRPARAHPRDALEDRARGSLSPLQAEAPHEGDDRAGARPRAARRPRLGAGDAPGEAARGAGPALRGRGEGRPRCRGGVAGRA